MVGTGRESEIQTDTGPNRSPLTNGKAQEAGGVARPDPDTDVDPWHTHSHKGA